MTRINHLKDEIYYIKIKTLKVNQQNFKDKQTSLEREVSKIRSNYRWNGVPIVSKKFQKHAIKDVHSV